VSEFIDLYREKNRIKAKMRSLRNSKAPEEYAALQEKLKVLNEKLNQIIEKDGK